MSKRTRALIVGATLAALNLAGLTAVAHAQANHDPDGKDARRLATERQDEATRRERPLTAPQQATADATRRAALAQERYYSTWGYSNTPAPTPAKPSGQPGWLVPGLGVLAAMALASGLAVLTAKRARRRVRVGHVA
jgi:hypothetical protein